MTTSTGPPPMPLAFRCWRGRLKPPPRVMLLMQAVSFDLLESVAEGRAQLPERCHHGGLSPGILRRGATRRNGTWSWKDSDNGQRDQGKGKKTACAKKRGPEW
jgi:hypothetical protein